MNDSFQLPDYLKKDNIINNGFIHSMSLLNNVFIYPFFDYSDFDHITLVEISRDKSSSINDMVEHNTDISIDNDSGFISKITRSESNETESYRYENNQIFIDVIQDDTNKKTFEVIWTFENDYFKRNSYYPPFGENNLLFSNEYHLNSEQKIGTWISKLDLVEEDIVNEIIYGEDNKINKIKSIGRKHREYEDRLINYNNNILTVDFLNKSNEKYKNYVYDFDENFLPTQVWYTERETTSNNIINSKSWYLDYYSNSNDEDYDDDVVF